VSSRPPANSGGARPVPASPAIDEARVRRLNDRNAGRGRYVLYWMQQSQRADENHALEYAIQRANALGLPLLVGFGVMDDYPDAALRHYRFMIEGLRDAGRALRARGIPFVVRHGSPPDVALALGREAALLVCDRGYLRHQRDWRAQVAEEASCEVVQVESDVVVPVEVTSTKAEFAARTIRPKLHRQLERFLVRLRATTLRTAWRGDPPGGLALDDVAACLAQLRIDRSVPAVPHHFTGGNREARRRLATFVRRHLDGYDERRNQPADHHVSHLSPYLHFGQLAPLTMARAVQEATTGSARDRESLLEELTVRRELACNFVQFTEAYDAYESLPPWAGATLAKHANDERPHRYTFRQLESGATHDRYWNAAMRAMRLTGYLHNHLRMYWGKKILEWSRSPQTAYRHALALNNRWFLDGRDCSSYANVGWLFGLHDRPWGEREIFGTVRYMSAGGLARKTDIEAYVAWAERLPDDGESAAPP
jgi:deoxyribodipyrimidine photo-lyase